MATVRRENGGCVSFFDGCRVKYEVRFDIGANLVAHRGLGKRARARADLSYMFFERKM
jgi:hypothetical protein